MDTYDYYENIPMFDIDEGFCEPDEKRLATCCFTGHRDIPKDGTMKIVGALKSTISYYASRGIVNFRAGGALGFDTLAAAAVIDLKRDNPSIKLVLDIPYAEQSEPWTEKDKRIYQFIKNNADEINIYGEKPKGKYAFTELMYKRNRALVDNSAYCICYLKDNKGGTAYTVDYAKRRGLEIVNVAEEE